MFQPKAKEGEKEYVNEIMIWDPFFNSDISYQEREQVRTSEPENGHIWLSIDPAETNISLRMEQRFSNKPPKGIMSIKFSAYNHPLQFQNHILNYGFLDEVACCKCHNKAKFYTYDTVTTKEKMGKTKNGRKINNTINNEINDKRKNATDKNDTNKEDDSDENDRVKKYYCGTHGKKIEPKTEILYGRKAGENKNNKFKNMNEYQHVIFLLNSLDLSEVRFAVLEQQMAINYRTTRLAQHIISTLMSILIQNKNYPIIYEISPKIKSHVYGVQLPKPELKKWTLRKAVFNAILNNEIDFLRLILKDDNPEKLIEMHRKNELTEGLLWDIIEPERNTVVQKEKNKIRKESGVLTRALTDLFDLCDSKEQIESLIIELGFHKMYFTRSTITTTQNNHMLLPPL